MMRLLDYLIIVHELNKLWAIRGNKFSSHALRIHCRMTLPGNKKNGEQLGQNIDLCLFVGGGGL